MSVQARGPLCLSRALLYAGIAVLTMAADVASVSAQGAAQQHGIVKGVVSLANAPQENATPEGFLLELRPSVGGMAPLNAVTDAAGNYEFRDVAFGDYVLQLNVEGFQSFTSNIRVQSSAPVVQNISVKLAGVAEKVEVKEEVESLSTASSGGSNLSLSEKQLENMPLAEENFRASLPLVPGVVRTPDGKLNLRGAGEDQSMLTVNDSKMTDPVTGSFSIPVPLDAVRSVRVDQTPYSAGNGGFSGGLTSVETVPPPESWRFGVRDLNVSLRGKNDHFVGIGRATPRVVFGGPLLGDKISFSQVFEYDVIRDPIRGLAWPHNEIKKQGFNSYSTLQTIVSSKQVVTVTLNVFPMRTQYADITALIPQTASSDYDRKGESVSLADTYSFSSGALFRTALTYTRFDSNAHGQGPEAMQLTPEGWAGNFFNAWERSSSQFEAAPIYQLAPLKLLGRHQVRVGLDLTRRSYRGTSQSQDVHILRQDASLAQQIQFEGTGLQQASILDDEEFIEDHWTPKNNLALDFGGRLTSQSIGRAAAFAPRFAVAYSPGKTSKTILRAGTGVFYDGVPLLAADYAGNPARIVNDYDLSGLPVGPPIVYENQYFSNGNGPLSTRVRRSPNTSVRSLVTSAELDRTLWRGAALRLGYIHTSTTDLFVINPIAESGLNAAGQQMGVLGLFNTGKENYSQAEATLRFHPVKDGELNISYIWSRSRGDLNTLSDIFIPFEQPVIRPNVYGVRPSDVPNRVVAWGTFYLPLDFVIGPVVDWHTGFPYSNVNELQEYAGRPDAQRFANFFSVDFKTYRDFRVPFLHLGSRKLRLGLYMINLTKHGNFNSVYNNITSPVFGEFTGYQRQQTAFLLSVVN